MYVNFTHFFIILTLVIMSHNLRYLTSVQFLFLQVVGATWYLLSIERFATCWKSQCRQENVPIKCLLNYLDCSNSNSEDRGKWASSTSVFSGCSTQNVTILQYGIFGRAVQYNVFSSVFTRKYLFTLWWGLQQLRYGSTVCSFIHMLCKFSHITFAPMTLVSIYLTTAHL